MKIIKWLDGKKTVIGGILSLTIGFLQIKNVLDSDTALYLLSLSGIILGIGVTHKIIKKNENDK